jgi:hypothetical protein
MIWIKSHGKTIAVPLTLILILISTRLSIASTSIQPRSSQASSRPRLRREQAMAPRGLKASSQRYKHSKLLL